MITINSWHVFQHLVDVIFGYREISRTRKCRYYQGRPPDFLGVGKWKRVLAASLATARHNLRQRARSFDAYTPLSLAEFIEEDAGVLND